MNTENQLSAFHWQAIALSQTLFIDGVPHVTRQAVGEWLEYADPQKAIDNIIDRNAYIEAYSVPLNLRATDGKKYDTLVYHPIGFLLIVMESGQPKAQAMKQAVAEFVWHFAGPKQMRPKERIEYLKLSRTLLADLGKTRDAFVRDGLIAHLREVYLALGQAMPNLARLGKDANQLDLSV